jgi:fibronectin-binding autotransporter adhesin
MPSSYSSSLKIELMATGENSGNTNTNLGTAMEQAVIGYGNIDYVSDANLTISITNSSASQASRCLVLNVTSVFGALTATRELIVPTSQKQYIVQNNTTGGQSITVKTSAGTGITVTNGRKAHLYVDGTNVIQMFDFVDINGGAIDGTPIGASSASTGAFTTLTSNGATTFTAGTASTTTGTGTLVITGGLGVSGRINAANFDGIIGANTAAAGSFTTLSATGVATFSAGTAALPAITTTGDTNTGIWFPAADTIAFTEGGVESMRITSSGNLGVGVTPSASNLVTLQSEYGLFTGNAQVNILQNAYYNSGFLFTGTGYATQYQQLSGQHIWKTSTASGTANNAITFTQAMTLDASGNLGIGTTSPSQKLDVSGGNARISSGSSTADLLMVDTGTTSGNVRLRSESNAMKLVTGGGVSATLDSSGNLGIGTTSPTQKLTVNGVVASIGPATALTASSFFIDYLTSQNLGRLAAVGNTTGTAAPLYFSQYSSNASVGRDAMIIDSSGNLLVGATINVSGTPKVAVNGSIQTDWGQFRVATVYDNSYRQGLYFDSSARNMNIFSTTNDSGGNILFSTRNAAGSSDADYGTERARIDSSGNLGLGVTPNITSLGGTYALLAVGKASGSGIIMGQTDLTAADSTAAQFLGKTTGASGYQLLGGMLVQTDGSSTTNAVGRLTFYTATGGSLSERARIDSSGNLGVGTTSPATRLHISGAGPVTFRINDTNTNSWDITNNSFLSFTRGSTEAMRIDSSGNLLVGTTDSSGTIGAGFKVLGGRPVVVNAASTDGAATVYEAYSTGAAAYRFYVGLGGTIFATSAVITPITSDERLKQNIVDYSNGLSQVLGLRPRYFEYKKEPGRKMAGFISQEVQTVMPEAIVPTLEDPEMMTYSIDWYPLFVKAIQEQQSLITQLTARITALEGA